ncbi:MAG TPA: hypothetical protein DEA55_01240 [Rhodospirillaceae bacterium]|nr:hypothetical protein [Rhodospirillaceae bacterium]
MRVHNTGNHTKMNQKGFSLIELSLALIIIGLLATPFLYQYNTYTNRRVKEQTSLSQMTIARAVSDFVDANGRYPCPTPYTRDEDATDHGREFCPPAIPVPGTCNGGICRATGRDANAAGGPDPVLIGAVPYASLNIPYEMALDGWKRKITYAVSERMANGSITPFDDTQGAISIVESDGDNLAPNAIVGSQPYLLVSHGDNGAGAYSTSGVLVAPCPAAVNGRERENCDNDADFETPGLDATGAGLRTLVAGAQYSDDVVYYDVSGLNGLWSYSAINNEDIRNNNLGYVGVGTPDPMVEFDVGGDIKAGTTHTIRYCDANGANCFTPDIIAGAGISCDGTSTEAMPGIANNAALCDLALPPGIITGPPCPNNQLANAVIGGQLQCVPYP